MFSKLFKSGGIVALQPGGMVCALFDYQRQSERYLIADDLEDYDEPIVEAALLHIASDSNEEVELTKICATSLAEIWIRKQKYEESRLVSMTPAARTTFEGIYRGLKKEIDQS